MAKMTKESVLYMGPELSDRASGLNERGAKCGKCMMFFTEPSKCAIVHQGGDATVSGDYGVCGLFVGGDPLVKISAEHKPMNLIPRTVAGYYEGPGVPTHCGNCQNYQGQGMEGLCKKVEGIVNEYGCCNSWDYNPNKELLQIKFGDVGL